MGLDQYIEHKEHDEELFYYRKLNSLQNYFESNFNIDNCEKVELTLDIVNDIKNLVDTVIKDNTEESAIKNFPTTNGFFYGGTDYDKWYFNNLNNISRDMNELLTKYKDDLENGQIFYTCWY